MKRKDYLKSNFSYPISTRSISKWHYNCRFRFRWHFTVKYKDIGMIQHSPGKLNHKCINIAFSFGPFCVPRWNIVPVHHRAISRRLESWRYYLHFRRVMKCRNWKPCFLAISDGPMLSTLILSICYHLKASTLSYVLQLNFYFQKESNSYNHTPIFSVIKWYADILGCAGPKLLFKDLFSITTKPIDILTFLVCQNPLKSVAHMSQK